MYRRTLANNSKTITGRFVCRWRGVLASWRHSWRRNQNLKKAMANIVMRRARRSSGNDWKMQTVYDDRRVAGVRRTVRCREASLCYSDEKSGARKSRAFAYTVAVCGIRFLDKIEQRWYYHVRPWSITAVIGSSREPQSFMKNYIWLVCHVYTNTRYKPLLYLCIRIHHFFNW